MDRLNRGVALSLAALALACGGERDNDGPYARLVQRTIPKIEESTGLTFKSPPKLEQHTREEVRAFLERRFNEEAPAAEVSGMERTYKRLGLLPESIDLRQYLLDLLTEQVAGYYDPKAKTLYVIEGGDDQLASVTVSHELVHALQDQYFNLDSLQSVRNNNDGTTAGQAIIEGQATLEQIASMIGGGNMAAALPGGWDRVRQMIREMQGAMPLFAQAPIVLQETLLFPYLSGAEFMRRFKEARPGKSPFDDMPVSTEQVMHPDRFFGSRDDPTVVTLPPPVTGTVVYENNLGEFETRLLLYEHLRDQASAVRGASGWDGDRYILVETARGDAVAWVSVWDTTVDAAEFLDLVDAALIKRFADLRPGTATGPTRTYNARGRTIYLAISDIGARPVVLYADVPQGVPPRLIDLQKVTLQE